MTFSTLLLNMTFPWHSLHSYSTFPWQNVSFVNKRKKRWRHESLPELFSVILKPTKILDNLTRTTGKCSPRFGCLLQVCVETILVGFRLYLCELLLQNMRCFVAFHDLLYCFLCSILFPCLSRLERYRLQYLLWHPLCLFFYERIIAHFCSECKSMSLNVSAVSLWLSFTILADSSLSLIDYYLPSPWWNSYTQHSNPYPCCQFSADAVSLFFVVFQSKECLSKSSFHFLTSKTRHLSQKGFSAYKYTRVVKNFPRNTEVDEFNFLATCNPSSTTTSYQLLYKDSCSQSIPFGLLFLLENSGICRPSSFLSFFHVDLGDSNFSFLCSCRRWMNDDFHDTLNEIHLPIFDVETYLHLLLESWVWRLHDLFICFRIHVPSVSSSFHTSIFHTLMYSWESSSKIPLYSFCVFVHHHMSSVCINPLFPFLSRMSLHL